MATNYPDYEQMVMQAYERKKENNTLPHGLMYLTPAKLKEECAKRCTTALSKKDEKVLRDFCGDLNEKRNCKAIIQQCDTDKFRPLVNYLKRKSESTDVKNIELLAWLIEFPGRPWEMGKTVYGDNDVDQEAVIKDISLAAEDPVTVLDSMTDNPPTTGGYKATGDTVIPEIPEIPSGGDDSIEEVGTDVKGTEGGSEKGSRGKSTRILIVAVMLSMVLGTGSMWWWKDRNLQERAGGCMYWKEDHYEPVACNQKVPNTMVIALDSVKLKSFRKITRPDTITHQAIGKVWYSKINGKIEYYTSGGAHPVVFSRQLKPITGYIIDKYILP